MPLLKRPDGVEIWWDETGEGPAVVICNTFNLASVEELVSLLAAERRVIVYEPRGVGRSTPAGPYDLEAGQADLEALLEETGPVATAFGIGDGAHRAVRTADSRPDLIERVVMTSTGLGELATTGFSSSTQVLAALMSLMRRDYRSGLRQMVHGSAHDEGVERDRVEQLAAAIPQDAAIGYLDSWIAAESAEFAQRLGPRLTIMGYPGNAWFPLELFEDMSLTLPEAAYEEVEDGPMGRPDLSAALLLRVTASENLVRDQRSLRPKA